MLHPPERVAVPIRNVTSLDPEKTGKKKTINLHLVAVFFGAILDQFGNLFALQKEAPKGKPQK